MAFNWNAKKIVDNNGVPVKSFDTTGTITVVQFEDDSRYTFWTENGDVWREGHPNIGKDKFLVAEEEVTEEDLVAAYRAADKLASKLGSELLERGFTLIDDDGDEIPYFNDVDRIYKLEERDF